ncbi:MAG TPA: DUF2156 domain-containing protein [Clostridiaceae bacterium]|nr:DUF2156 domain-containing protein [Clostridiaceae bacterium]
MNFHSLQPFTIEQAELYTHYFKQSNTRLADACPNSRFAWNVGYAYRYLISEDCFCLISDGGIFTEPHFSLPLGKLNSEKLHIILQQIEPIFEQENWSLVGMFIDQAYTALFSELTTYNMEMSYEEDFSDYIYRTSDLANLKGKKYRAKRNHVNRFIRDYAEFEYTSLTKSDQEKAVELVRTWCQDKEVDCSDPLASDCKPISNLFDYWDELDVRGGAIYYNSDLIAFSMGSVISDGQEAVIHFEKAHPDYEGLYSVINQLTVINEFSETELINREEDMGEEGIRIAKESYLPTEKLKKYRIALSKK